MAIARSFRGGTPSRARRIAIFLKSRDLRVRELALDALRNYPPVTYKDELGGLLDDPAEEMVLRAAELLVRTGAPDARRRLEERARSASERVRRFILGRLAAAGPAEAAPRVAAHAPVRGAPGENGIAAPAANAGPPAKAAPPAKRSGSPAYEEYAFPVARLVPAGGPA